MTRGIGIHSFTSGTHEGWDRFVRRQANATVYHLSAWLSIINRVFRHRGQYLYAEQHGAVVGVLPIIHLSSTLFGRYSVSLPYFNYGGVVAREREVEQLLIPAACAAAQSEGSRHLELRHTGNGNRLARTDKVAMVRELPDQASALWTALGSKVRAQIKRPLREKVDVRLGKSELVEEFYYVFCRNMRDLGTPVYSKKWFVSVLSAFPDSASIVVVRHKGRPAAAGFLMGFRDTLEIPWASSIREMNRIGVNMLMYWECLKYAIEQGYGRFDFGRSTRNSGTYRFKQQWGAVPVPLSWSYPFNTREAFPQINPDNPRYQMAIGIWKRIPLFVANRIGPMIVRGIG